LAKRAVRPYLIAYSGFAREQDRERTRLAGFDAYVAKCDALDELQVLLERLKLTHVRLN